MPGRFDGFTEKELNVLRDGLSNEAELEPEEDPSFVEVADGMITEIEDALRER